MQDWQMTDEVARVEIDGLENDGQEIDGPENGRRAKNEGLTLKNWNLQNSIITDWKIMDRLITAYKAGLEIKLTLRHASRGLTTGHTVGAHTE